MDNKFHTFLFQNYPITRLEEEFTLWYTQFNDNLVPIQILRDTFLTSA